MGLFVLKGKTDVSLVVLILIYLLFNIQAIRCYYFIFFIKGNTEVVNLMPVHFINNSILA